MWSNLNNVVGAAIQTVQKLQSDLETQMDQAVGVDQKNAIEKVIEPQSEDSTPVITMDREEEVKIAPKVTKSQKKKKNSISAPVTEEISKTVEENNNTNEIISELKRNHSDLLENIKKDYDNKINELQNKITESESKCSSKDLKFNEEIKKLKEKHNSEKNNLLNELNKSNESRMNEIENLKKIYDEKIQNLSKNTSDNNNNDNNNESAPAVAVDNSKYIEEIAQLNISLENQTRSVQRLESQLQEKDNEISSLNDNINSKSEENVTLNNDIIKLKEIICDRERALETSTTNFSELNKSNEDLLTRLNDLTLEISQKDMIIKQQQTQSVEDMEIKKQLLKSQELLKEKQAQLAQYEQEGQNLSKKQGEMEKTVRKTKSEVKEKDNEIQKLKESKEQLMKALQEVQDMLKKQETEVNNTSKNYSAMQAVSQATSDKLSKLETELNTKNDELSSQKRALENCWTENNELKRNVAELKADRDDLRRQIGEGTSKVMETESSRRDIEQREAVLRATSKQLQDSLQRQMQESSMREERLRDEVNEMRQRWQEAVTSREAMSSDLSSASAPLLRQISSLQESLRLKTESWQSIESSLTERALRAENTSEMAEHKKSLIEEQFIALKQQHSSNTVKLQETQTLIVQHENEINRLKRAESQWIESKSDLESRLSLEIAQRQNMQTSLREFETRQKMELQNNSESHGILLTQKDLEISKLKKDIEMLQDEIKPKNKSYKSNKKSFNNNDESSLFSTSSENNINNDSIGLMPGSLPNGDVSFAATEKLHQKSRQKDEELKSLNIQIQQLQQSRNALLEEVSYLSMRNSQLEEQMATMPKLIEDVNSSHKRIDLLLILLGEKEEELDAAMSDMREIKSMYRSHMEDLMGKMTVGGSKDDPVLDTN